jgi:hypothetical protein
MPLGRYWRRWEYNIKINIKIKGAVVLGWSQQAQNRLIDGYRNDPSGSIKGCEFLD